METIQTLCLIVIAVIVVLHWRASRQTNVRLSELVAHEALKLQRARVFQTKEGRALLRDRLARHLQEPTDARGTDR